jgi:hypothetical protein
MRIRAIAVVLGLVLAGLLFAPPATAQEHDDEAPPTSLVKPPGSVSIDSELAFTEATVTTPAEPAPRTFDAYHTAVFVQSWLPYAFFGQNVVKQDPPLEVPVYRVDMVGTWGGVYAPGLTPQTVYYATDGTTAWLSYPQNQPVTGPPQEPPPPSDWFVGPPRVIEAFNGTAQLEETLGLHEQTPNTEAAESTGDSSSFIFWWVLGCVVLVAAVASFFFIRRRRETPSEPVREEELSGRR